jgi:hypothetical protein
MREAYSEEGSSLWSQDTGMTTVRPAVGTSSTNATTTITIPTEPREPVTKSWTLGSYVGILLVEEYVKEILACISCNWSTIRAASVLHPRGLVLLG